MDNLRTHLTVCQGGLITNVDPLTHASALGGSALRMINYEPATDVLVASRTTTVLSLVLALF